MRFLHVDIVAAATIRAHCLIASEAAGPLLIPGTQARALQVPPPMWGPGLMVFVFYVS